MPPRRRVQYTQDSIDQQLQQIHLLDQSSSSENLEQLGPIIKQIHQNRQQDAFLRTVSGLVQSKENEIEKICSDNYQDFISSVSTLFTIKSYTNNLRDKIQTLDSSVTQVGRSLVEKKKALLSTKKTAANLDEAIDNLQACLKVLDVVNRVGEMIKQEKYWSALRVSPSHLCCQFGTEHTCSLLKKSIQCPRLPSPRRPSSNISCRRSRRCGRKSRTLLPRRRSSGSS